MEPKKSKKAQLENKKGLYIQVGMVIALSLILISFEWTTRPPLIEEVQMVQDIDFDSDIVITVRDEPEEVIEPEAPDVMEVIEIVENDIETEVYFPDFEIPDNFKYSYIFDPEPEGIEEDDTPYVVVEDMPTFNGGDPKIESRKYIAENMNYPEIAAENGVRGKVLVQFCVDKHGKVVDVVITRSVDPALDKEAIRVITDSPKWQPGKQRGKAVKVIYSFPINFVLQ